MTPTPVSTSPQPTAPQPLLRELLVQVRTSAVATLALAIVVCGIYPLVVCGIAQLAFPDRANGLLIVDTDGKVRGSALLGQSFSADKYFHPRPSAAGNGYAAGASAGTNLGPTSAKLIEGQADDPATKDTDESFSGVKQLAEQYRKTNGLAAETSVPADAVTRSASGLDPHITPANARFQAARVAKTRRVTLDVVNRLIAQHTEGREFGLLGEPRVNVVKLNLALDTLPTSN
ncbi:MAG: K(+)-transporting ATPase subunit C [Phycisphaerae bacterium]|nr:K(+)-transporting ATPase subunit C [Tepidisphaeraceae bacterium]